MRGLARSVCVLATAVLFPASAHGQASSRPNAPAASPASPAGRLDPGLHLDVREERYLVRERYLSDAIEALNRMRLEEDATHLAQGLTTYQLGPQLGFQRVADGCVVRQVQLDVDVTIKLPEWEGLQRAARVDRDRWRNVLARITAHEYAHRDVTLEAAGRLFATLRFLTSGTCARLERAARQTIAAADEELQRLHAEIDGSDPGGVPPTGS